MTFSEQPQRRSEARSSQNKHLLLMCFIAGIGLGTGGCGDGDTWLFLRIEAQPGIPEVFDVVVTFRAGRPPTYIEEQTHILRPIDGKPLFPAEEPIETVNIQANGRRGIATLSVEARNQQGFVVGSGNIELVLTQGQDISATLTLQPTDFRAAPTNPLTSGE